MNKPRFAAAIACVSPTTGICANAPSPTVKIIVAVAGILAAVFVAWFFFGKKESKDMPADMEGMDHMNM